MFDIEKDVALPPPGQRGRGTAKYPTSNLEVGDSFFVPAISNVEKTRVRSAVGNVKLSRRCCDREFTVRSVAGGLRVWRTK